MEINSMDLEQVETRLAEVKELLHTDGADLDALESEIRSLKERRAEINADIERRKAEVNEVLETAVEIKSFEKEEVRKTMDIKELRNTKEYIDAYAEYIKGNEKVVRQLITENAGESVTGNRVAVPTYVEDRIWTDWDKSPILSRIRKVFIEGNYKVGYEASATGAVIHEEGTNPPQEEQLVLAYVDFIAEYLKKWIKVSDTVMALRGQAFIDYLFDEFGHQIALALENMIVAELEASTLTADVNHAIDGDAVLYGLGALSDEATNPIVIMSKANYVAIKSIRTTAGSRLEDPFEGLEVLFNNTATGVLVGDLDGVVANFPEGMDFKYIVDDKSLAEYDLVKIVGKLLVAVHLVRPNGFALVKPE